MSLEVKGVLEQILPIQSGTSKAGKEWSKQEFVIETEDQYPKKICFTLFGDKSSLLDGFQQGDTVNVAFNVESREYNGRWFHNINAWRITNEAAGTAPDAPEFGEIPPPNEDLSSSEPNNDLPF